MRTFLGEGEVLAQAGAGGQPRHRDAAPGIVVVDQLDHLEDVGPVALAVHHQQVGQVGLDVRERRRADRDHDVVRARGVGGPVAELQKAVAHDPVEQLLGAGLGERHPPGAQRLEDRRVVVDPEHADAAVGEAQRQRQTDAAQADDRYEARLVHQLQ